MKISESGFWKHETLNVLNVFWLVIQPMNNPFARFNDVVLIGLIQWDGKEQMLIGSSSFTHQLHWSILLFSNVHVLIVVQYGWITFIDRQHWIAKKALRWLRICQWLLFRKKNWPTPWWIGGTYKTNTICLLLLSVNIVYPDFHSLYFCETLCNFIYMYENSEDLIYTCISNAATRTPLIAWIPGTLPIALPMAAIMTL